MSNINSRFYPAESALPQQQPGVESIHYVKDSAFYGDGQTWTSLVKSNRSTAMALVGDSITARYSSGEGTITGSFAGNGYVNWACELSGQIFTITNFAMSGSGMTPLSSISPSFQTQVESVIASNIRTVTILGCVNDVQSDATFSQITTAYSGLITSLVNDGITVYWCTCPPMNSTYGNYTTARQGVLLGVNAWIREQVATLQNRGIILVDLYAIVTDSASKTSNYKTNYTSDNLHPRNIGAYFMGKELARVWKLTELQTPLLISCAGDAKVDDTGTVMMSGSDNILQNGLFNLGTPAAGVAANWTVALTGTAASVNTIVADANGVGSAQQMVMTSTTSGDTVRLRATSFANRINYSGKLLLTGQLVVSAITNLKNIEVYLYGFSTSNLQYRIHAADATDAALVEGWTGTFKILVDIGALGFTSFGGGCNVDITATFGGSGGATVQVSRVSVRSFV